MKRLCSITILLAAICATPLATVSQPIEPPAFEQTDSPVVNVMRGAIEIKTFGIQTYHFHIYSITGQLLKRVALSNGASTIIELPQGCYIVKCEKWSKKVAIC